MMTLEEIEKLVSRNYWTVNIGMARLFLALCPLVTLVFNSVDVIFIKQSQIRGFSSLNLFYMFNDFGVSRIVAVLILLLVISGFYPRFTCILHFWVSLSFSTSSVTIEGGDQITSIMTLLLIPILLFDKRVNHYTVTKKGSNSFYVNCICYFTILLIALQAAFLYFQASLGKVNVDEWANGTAVYYWLNDSVFGLNDTILYYFNTLLKSPVIVTLMTWGTMAMELFIAFAIFSKNPKIKRTAFVLGVGLHLIIAIAFGLISFFFAMVGVLLLYLLPFGNIMKRRITETQMYYVQSQA